MSRQPLLIVLLAFCLGIFFQDYFCYDWGIGFSVLIFSVSFLTGSLLKIKLLLKFRNSFLLSFFFSLGVFCHWQNSIPPQLPIFKSKKQQVIFQLKKKLNSNEKSRRYEIEILEVLTQNKAQNFNLLSIINIPKDLPTLDFKHYYKAEIYLNPVENTNLDFQFNYQKYLARQSIYFRAYLPNSFVSQEKTRLTINEKIKQERLYILTRINESQLHPRNKEFLKGIILADRTDMDSEVVQDFNKSGLVHLLAISGSHMAILFWLILLILKPIFSTKYKSIPIILALLLIWIFAIFIDYGSSVVRSCIMISVYYMMVILQRKPDLLQAIAVSGFIILIHDTQQLYDVGFQLSYLAVFGIYWLNPVLMRKFRKPKYKIEILLYNILCISLSAQLATLPLVLYYFHQFSFISIFANLIVLPFSEIIIIFSLLMVGIYAVDIQVKYIENVYDLFIDILLKVIHYFANIDSLYNINISFNLAEVIISLIMLYYLKYLIGKMTFKYILKFSLIALIFLSFRWGLDFYYSNKNEILRVNRFQNNVLIIKENKAALFITSDSSITNSLKKSVINPYLTSRRLSNYNTTTVPKNTTSIIYNNTKIDFRNKEK